MVRHGGTLGRCEGPRKQSEQSDHGTYVNRVGLAHRCEEVAGKTGPHDDVEQEWLDRDEEKENDIQIDRAVALQRQSRNKSRIGEPDENQDEEAEPKRGEVGVKGRRVAWGACD